MLDRALLALARFGRLSGMKLPGIKYSSLRGGLNHSGTLRPMGGGIYQDGVFSNMNAKPERVRESLDPHDRGDNDDLVR